MSKRASDVWQLHSHVDWWWKTSYSLGTKARGYAPIAIRRVDRRIIAASLVDRRTSFTSHTEAIHGASAGQTPCARWAVGICDTRALKSVRNGGESCLRREGTIGCQRKKIQKHGTLTKDTKLRHVQNKVCVVDSKTCWNIRCATKS